MKITTFLFFLCFFCSRAENISSQNTHVSIERSNVKLEEIFNCIESQTNYLFIYNQEVDVNRNITVQVKDKSVVDVLNLISKKTGLNYTMEGTHIILSAKTSGNSAQTIVPVRLITGIVKDEQGEPVIGANIIIKGSEKGTVSDIDGKFSLSIPENASILQISFIGYQPTDITVRPEKTDYSIVLKENTEMLNEVVVTGYGGTQIRSKLTNSISSVKEEALKRGVFSNPGQALSGAVPGLRVIQSSGDPSAAPQIVLRGGTNLDGSGSPLILLDGQIRDNLNNINPENIESMEILKDAGATALYGARANNGVVLVTSKKGKAGRTSINFKAKVGLNYLNSPYEFLNAEDYLYWQRTAVQRSAQIFQSSSGEWVGTTTMGSLKGVQPYGTGNIYWSDPEKKIPANGNKDPRAVWSPMIYTPDLAFLLQQGWRTMKDPVYGNEIIFRDWDMTKANIQSPSTSQDYNVSMSGGNDRGHYYTGIGYNYTQGMPLDNYYKRLSVTFNADYKLTNWLTSYSSFSFTDSKANGLPNGNTMTRESEGNYFSRALSAPPTLRGYNADGEYILGRDLNDGNQHVNLGKFNRDNTKDQFTMNQNFNIDLLKNLSLKIGAIWMYDEDFNEAFSKDYMISSNNWDRGRRSSAYFSRTLKQTYNAVANYDLSFLHDHHLNVLAGGEFYDKYTKGFSAIGSGAPTDDFGDLELTLTDENMRDIDSWHSRERILSFFGRLNYDYKEKYLLSATVRRDGYSSLLGNNRYGTFPGISAGWIFGREDFIQKLTPVLSFGKLRASFGLNGNVSGIGPYDLQGSYGTILYGSQVGYNIGGFPNSGLRWEKSYTWEIGLDLGLLENRINTNFTFYNRETKDKYAEIPLPGSSGVNSFKTNNGGIRNRGFEFDLNFRVIQTKDWKWNIGLNGAFNKNIITKLPYNGLEKNRQDSFQVYDPKTGQLIWAGGYQEGIEPRDCYSYVAEGIYKNAGEIRGDLIDKTISTYGDGILLYGPEAWNALSEEDKINPDGSARALPIQPGDVKWKDVNNDGVIDEHDQVKLGNFTPHWTGGINTTLTYKNFTFYARMDYALDYKIYDQRSQFIMGDTQGTFNTLVKTKDTWTPENPNAKYPTYYWADQLGKRNYNRTSSMFIYNGNYLAFREVSLSWQLPSNWINKLLIQHLELTVTGQNLGYLTAAKGVFSPEVTDNVSGGYPLPKSVIFGLNLTF